MNPTKLITASLVASAALLTGCSMFDGGGSSGSRASTNTDPYSTAGSAGYRTSGTGKLNFSAPSAGEVMVIDRTTGRTVLTQRVNAGDQLAVTPETDGITLNGRSIYNRNLVKDNQHFIDFRPDNAGYNDGRYNNNSNYDPRYNNNGTYNNGTYNNNSGTYNNPNYNNSTYPNTNNPNDPWRNRPDNSTYNPNYPNGGVYNPPR